MYPVGLAKSCNFAFKNMAKSCKTFAIIVAKSCYHTQKKSIGENSRMASGRLQESLVADRCKTGGQDNCSKGICQTV